MGLAVARWAAIIMGAGHVPELDGAVLDPASGSVQVGGPSMLIQREEGGPGLLTGALVQGKFPHPVGCMTAVTHPRGCRDCS